MQHNQSRKISAHLHFIESQGHTAIKCRLENTNGPVVPIVTSKCQPRCQGFIARNNNIQNYKNVQRTLSYIPWMNCRLNKVEMACKALCLNLGDVSVPLFPWIPTLRVLLVGSVSECSWIELWDIAENWIVEHGRIQSWTRQGAMLIRSTYQVKGQSIFLLSTSINLS